MNKEAVLNFFGHFGKVYIRSLTSPMIHGYFDDRAKFEEALAGLDEGITLYFVAHEILDTTLFPNNCFEKMKKNSGLKTDNICVLRYFVLDIDPTNSAEVIDGKKVKRNLTVKENLQVIDDAKAIKSELLNNGFENIGLCNSGNGAYLIFPFKNIQVSDQETQNEVTELLNKFAYIIKRRVKLFHSNIDFKTIKISQCFKLPGTLSTKGKATSNNPYRHCSIVEDWGKKSCWDAIKEYVENFDTSDLITTDSSGTHLNVPQCMEYCEKTFPLYYGGGNDYYARVYRGEKFKDLLIDSGDFIKELRIFLRRETGLLDLEPKEISMIIDYMKDQAYQCEKSEVASRAYFDQQENSVYYDLCNDKDVIKICPDGITVENKSLGMFVTQVSDEEQVMYKPAQSSDLPALLKKIVKLSDENILILATYLCVCFLGNCFPTPIMLITGSQGSSKSTLTRFIQKIVHPSQGGLMSLIGEKKHDLAIALSRRLMTCFDNATGIKAEISDLLCSAVTQASYQTRELYTTRDECLIIYRSIMVINGIDVVSKRTDLMERCLMLELERIKPEERRTENQMNQMFSAILPSILGAIFSTIKNALSIDESNLEINSLTRMADFEKWSIKFAISMGYSIEEYQKALENNIECLTDAVSFGNPTIFAICKLMEGRSVYKEGVLKTYTNCDDILTEKMTTQEKAMFPKSAAAFSRSLGGVDRNLRSFGLTYDIRNVGRNKEITIWNDGTVIPNVNPADKVSEIAYKNTEIFEETDGESK